MPTDYNSKSIAVLPFVNIGKPENEYFADGITEEIINALTKIEGLKVTARTSSFYYKGKSMDARHIGNDLGVETLLEGSVRIINERVRISTQLVKTDNGFHIWSESFDRNLNDIFDLQDEISLLIADKIRENFGHLEVQDSLISHPNISAGSYNTFLKAKSLISRFNRNDIEVGIELLQQVVSDHPHFTLAYVHMHYAYNIMAAGGLMPVKKAFDIGGKYLKKAQELNLQLPEVHHSLGWDALNKEWDFVKAVKHLKRAIELQPNYSDAHQKLFITLILEGNLQQAQEHIEVAYNLDPLNDLNNYFMGYNCYINKEHEKLANYFNKCFELNSKFLVGYGIYGLALLDQGRPEELLKIVENIPEMTGAFTEKSILKGLSFSYTNRLQELHPILKELNSSLKGPSRERIRFFLIYINLFLNNIEEVYNLIQQGIKNREPLMTLIKVDPHLKRLHNEPRFQYFLNEIYAKSNECDDLPGSTKPELSGYCISEEEVSEIIDDLKIKMEVEEAFLNQEVSLRNLAKAIGTHPNKLSKIINQHFGKNFNDYINQYRLQKFKKLALSSENKHLTILGLAYDSGFNSKTVFNTFFKKELGVTPKQWLKTH